LIRILNLGNGKKIKTIHVKNFPFYIFSRIINYLCNIKKRIKIKGRYIELKKLLILNIYTNLVGQTSMYNPYQNSMNANRTL